MLILLIHPCLRVTGQTNCVFTFGAGIPELLNVGARIQTHQIELGITIGGFSNSAISISGNIYLHFAGSSKFSDLHPWYGKIGIDYLRGETEYDISSYDYLDVRFGRDFNFTSKIGINIEAGMAYQIYYDKVVLKQSNNFLNLDFNFELIPSLGISFFYRF